MANIAFCGLDCEVCGERTEEKRNLSKKLQDLVAEMDAYVEYLPDPRYKGWAQFKDVLNAITEHPDCPGCRENGGNPDCGLRNCAREKEVEFCYKCSDFPCVKLPLQMIEASKRVAVS